MTADPLVWHEIYWGRPLDAGAVLHILRAWVTNVSVSSVVLETRATKSGVRCLVGAPRSQVAGVESSLQKLAVGTTLGRDEAPRQDVTTVRRLGLTSRERGLRADPEGTAKAIYAALSRVAADEEVVIQTILGPHHKPLAVAGNITTATVQPMWQTALRGDRKLDADHRQAVRTKYAEHGFSTTIRIGVRSARVERRKSLILGTFAALRSVESPSAHLRLMDDQPRRLNSASRPWHWPLVLNLLELTALLAAPIGEDLPGLPRLHPKPVAPEHLARPDDRIIAAASAPGVDGPLGYGLRDASQHTWVLGPNGTGKSTLLLNLITQDLDAGRGLVVIEPKDLVADVLAHIPKHRREDVVLLDASDPESVVGLNPLASEGRSPDLVADTLVSLLHSLHADSWGPRTQDVLMNSILTLARRPGSTLVELPLLLGNPAFRRRVLKESTTDPTATGPFWATFEAMSEGERAQVIAPVMNKIRPWIVRPALRAVLGQARPRFDVRDVLTSHKVLLVPLSKGTLGPDGAQLLAALVLAELWQAIRERAAIPADQRQPVTVYVDEAQDFLRLPTDLADVLATSRALGAYFHLAHQHRAQLTPDMRAAFESNARSRIVFQLAAADAKAMADGQTVLKAEDFTSLAAYDIYARLMRDGHLQDWASGRTLPAPKPSSDPADVRRRSRASYAARVEDIEAAIAALVDPTPASWTNAPGRVPRRPS